MEEIVFSKGEKFVREKSKRNKKYAQKENPKANKYINSFLTILVQNLNMKMHI